MKASPARRVTEWDGAHVAVRKEPQGLSLTLLISEHEEAVELARGGTVLDAAHVGKAHGERLEVLRLEVLHAADEKSALRSAVLEFGVVAPELVAHVVALIQRHL